MSVSDRVMIAAKQKRHDEICKIVHSEIGRFTSVVGGVLAELKSLEMYSGTFEAFVKAEFGLEKNRAYQLIEAHNTKASLSKILDKTEVPQVESHLREIAKAPEEKQVEVAKAVAEVCRQEERKPTASDYKKAVEEATSPKVAAVEGELVYEDMDDDDEEIGGDKKKKPIELSTLPEELLPQLASAAQSVTNLKTELKRLSRQTGGEWLELELNDISLKLDAVRHAIKGTYFSSICPKCRNDKKAKQTCQVCRTYGWIAESRVEFAKANCGL